MKQGNQSGVIRGQNVEKQFEQLEQQNPTNEENKKGSTNEIQPDEIQSLAYIFVKMLAGP